MIFNDFSPKGDMDQTQRRKKSVPLFMKKFYDGQTRPNMIFSVIGDSENFIPKPWSKSRFQEALIYAAKATGGLCLIYAAKAKGGL